MGRFALGAAAFEDGFGGAIGAGEVFHLHAAVCADDEARVLTRDGPTLIGMLEVEARPRVYSPGASV